jgi:cell wall-associated NlpC family hydrolase
LRTLDYLAIPYEQKNCYQLVRYFYLKEFNLELVNMDSMKDDAYRLIHKEIIKQSNNFVMVKEPKYGTLVLMNNADHHSIINHIGVYVGEGRVLHTSKKTGCVISKIEMLNIKGYANHPNLV